MARLRHTAVIEALPRDWFDGAVGLGHDLLSEHLGGPAFPLADGARLAPGSWYATPDDDVTVTVDAWDRDGGTAGVLHTAADGVVLIATGRLTSAAAPRAVEVALDGRVTTRGVGWLTTGEGRGTVDLTRWWAAAAGTGGPPPVAVEGRVGPVRGTVTVSVSPAGDGRWRVDGRVRLVGRGPLRPLASLALFLARRALAKALRAKVDAVAARWNRVVPGLVAASRDELRALLAAELTRAGSVPESQG